MTCGAQLNRTRLPYTLVIQLPRPLRGLEIV